MSELLHALDHGIYGFSEAAKLLRRNSAQVRRWANGYSYKRKFDIGQQKGVLRTERSNPDVLNFKEVIELFFVREFTTAGVPLQSVRDAANRLTEEFGPFPFATCKLLLLGKDIVSPLEGQFISASTGQLVGDFAVRFAKELRFTDEYANLWKPSEGKGQVVIDPTRMRGEPTLISHGTPTRVVFTTYQKEQEYEPVAQFYDLSINEVRAAVEFEMAFSNVA